LGAVAPASERCDGAVELRAPGRRRLSRIGSADEVSRFSRRQPVSAAVSHGRLQIDGDDCDGADGEPDQHRRDKDLFHGALRVRTSIATVL